MNRIGIIGAGSWGTALAVLLGAKGLPVRLWGHDPAHVEEIRTSSTNAAYLPGATIPKDVSATADLADLAASDTILFVTPSRVMREMAARFAECAPPPGALLLSCTKGIEQGSGNRMTEILAEHFPKNEIAVLSGPSHAEEVVRGMPTALVLGCKDRAAGARLQQMFSGGSFRAYTSDDILGIELGGALKNIFAIAAGISDGLGLGDNSKAALVTRSLAELIRLGVAMGGRRETFHGLSGIGDLMVTCFSQHSRNRRVGERIGQGETLAQISASMTMVAEGVPTTQSARECASRFSVETPIIGEIHAILFEKKPPLAALEELLAREPRPEEDSSPSASIAVAFDEHHD